MKDYDNTLDEKKKKEEKKKKRTLLDLHIDLCFLRPLDDHVSRYPVGFSFIFRISAPRYTPNTFQDDS
jgi:hypothetical protein